MTLQFDSLCDDFLNFRDLEEELSKICDKSEIEECLKQQLLEIEMIQSMFSNPGEFIMDDPGLLEDVKDYLSDKTTKIPGRLDFSVNLIADKKKTEVCIALPIDYPVTEPDVFVRNNQLNRKQQKLMNKELTLFIDTLRGETCVCSIIFWLQENIDKYTTGEEAPLEDKEAPIKVKTSFSRLWIYSHHIFSKTKRKDILSLAETLHLTGFMLPGKPGVICVEGDTDDADEWWAAVKAMNWKKIVMRRNETAPLDSAPRLNKFDDFQEIGFKCMNSNRGTERHMDMGELYKYLKEHNCEYVFIDYFGVSGQNNI